MAGLIIVSLLAAQLAAAPSALPASGPTRTPGSASAQAFVRILPGARVRLGAAAQPGGYKQVSATVMIEDGSRRPAKLVEFQ